MASVPGFLTKTFEIFSSPEYSECCGWGPNGDTIVIKKVNYRAAADHLKSKLIIYLSTDRTIFKRSSTQVL